MHTGYRSIHEVRSPRPKARLSGATRSPKLKTRLSGADNNKPDKLSDATFIPPQLRFAFDLVTLRECPG